MEISSHIYHVVPDLPQTRAGVFERPLGEPGLGADAAVDLVLRVAAQNLRG